MQPIHATGRQKLIMKKPLKVQSYSPKEVAAAWRRERPDLSHDGLGITIRIRALTMLIDQRLTTFAEKLGISQGDLILLYAMRRSGPPYCMRPTDIFRLLSVTSGAATYRTDKLVEKGLAMRVPDSQDRRSHLIQLTDRGIEMVDWATSSLAQDSNACLESMNITPEELSKFNDLLSKLEQGWLMTIPNEENPLGRSSRDEPPSST